MSEVLTGVKKCNSLECLLFFCSETGCFESETGYSSDTDETFIIDIEASGWKFRPADGKASEGYICPECAEPIENRGGE